MSELEKSMKELIDLLKSQAKQKNYNDRLMIFTDAEYVIQSLRNLNNNNQKRVGLNKINWNNIFQWITGSKRLIRVYYYSCALDKDANLKTHNEQKEYLNNLKESIPNLEIKLGRLEKIGNSWVQKGVDVMLAVDMVSKASKNHYDIAALITGDSDFADLISVVKNEYGKQVQVFSFDRSDCKVYDNLKFAPDQHYLITAEIGKKFNFWNIKKR
ncbi:hypothetical protein DRJ22_05250 [Candidatus Woesearchaeota archaeon]|nr:MAG: hypothetical protein DRJ22_05250 [Candidatus Woesearchaeota archaeon]